MPVLSDNLRSFLGWGIKVHEGGCYNHFMWLIEKGTLASQGFWGYKIEPLDDYLGGYRLKIWDLFGFTEEHKQKVLAAIKVELARPWYKNCYDVLAYPGQLLGIHWLQTPGMEICSDKAKYLRLIDGSFDLKYPDPEQVNTWLTEHPEKYKVYGRYTPD